MWRSNCLCLWLSFSANWLIKSCFVVSKPLFHISRLRSKAVLLFLNLFLISAGYIQKLFCCFWTSFLYQWVTFKSCCFWTSFSYQRVSCILHSVPTSPQHEFNQLLTSPVILLASCNYTEKNLTQLWWWNVNLLFPCIAFGLWSLTNQLVYVGITRYIPCSQWILSSQQIHFFFYVFLGLYLR